MVLYKYVWMLVSTNHVQPHSGAVTQPFRPAIAQRLSISASQQLCRSFDLPRSRAAALATLPYARQSIFLSSAQLLRTSGCIPAL